MYHYVLLLKIKIYDFLKVSITIQVGKSDYFPDSNASGKLQITEQKE